MIRRRRRSRRRYYIVWTTWDRPLIAVATLWPHYNLIYRADSGERVRHPKTRNLQAQAPERGAVHIRQLLSVMLGLVGHDEHLTGDYGALRTGVDTCRMTHVRAHRDTTNPLFLPWTPGFITEGTPPRATAVERDRPLKRPFTRQRLLKAREQKITT